MPASFDAVARELTVRPPGRRACATSTLLEEPQAAFYAWLDAQRRRAGASSSRSATSSRRATSAAAPPTSRLIAVGRRAAANLALERVAVGDHILLGGDNMDLALAYAAGARKLAQARARSSTPGRSASLAPRLPRGQGAAARRPRRLETRRSSILGPRQPRSSAARSRPS